MRCSRLPWRMVSDEAPPCGATTDKARIASLPLAPHTAYRRSELQAMYAKFEAEIEKLNQRVEEQACKRLGARLLLSPSWSGADHRVGDRGVSRRSRPIRRQQGPG